MAYYITSPFFALEIIGESSFSHSSKVIAIASIGSKTSNIAEDKISVLSQKLFPEKSSGKTIKSISLFS